LARVARGEPSVLVIDWRHSWQALGGFAALIAEDLPTGERLARYCKPPQVATPEILVEDRT
jgi:hypothetical protein